MAGLSDALAFFESKKLPLGEYLQNFIIINAKLLVFLYTIPRF